jgi:hypothetical protein
MMTLLILWSILLGFWVPWRKDPDVDMDVGGVIVRKLMMKLMIMTGFQLKRKELM